MTEPFKEWTVLSMLKWATSYFEEKNVKNPRFSIEWLLSHLLQVKRLDLYLMYDKPLSPQVLKGLRALVKRRALHEPLQYITGETDFLNTIIKVRPGVLIPRMETEQLVEMILSQNPDNTQPLSVLDIGTGTGCIPIALKKNRSSWEVSATDISKDALIIAEENAKLNGVEVNFMEDDLFSSSIPKGINYDLIISNPPYILNEERSTLDAEVINYEPDLALFCKSTHNIYSAIIEFSAQRLKTNGSLFLELHEHHAQEVLKLSPPIDWLASIHEDYDGKDRFLVSKKI